MTRRSPLSSTPPGRHSPPSRPPAVIFANDGMSVTMGTAPHASASESAKPEPSRWLAATK